MSERRKSRRRRVPRAEGLHTDFARRRAFDAIADFFERLHQKPFTPSQAVSIARALAHYAEQEARRRQAHGGTAPGRARGKAKPNARFKSREFVARCVGLAPATLRKAEAVIEAAERNPDLRGHVMGMDETRKVGRVFSSLHVRWNPPPLSRTYTAPPADREFGERFIKDLVAAALGSFCGAKRFGSSAKVAPSSAARKQRDGRR